MTHDIKIKFPIVPSQYEVALDHVERCKRQILFIYGKLRGVLEPEGIKVGICGGAIRDVFGFNRLPKDIDIFFLADDSDGRHLQSEIKHLLEQGKMIRYNPLNMSRNDKPTSLYANLSSKSTSYPLNLMPFVNGAYFAFENFEKEMASKLLEKEIPMQFMFRSIKKISNFFDLLHDFDWNICRYGIFDGSFFDLSDDFTQLKINKSRLKEAPTEGYGNEIVLRRGMSFSFRYDIPIEPESLEALCFAVGQEMAEKNKKSKDRTGQLVPF